MAMFNIFALFNGKQYHICSIAAKAHAQTISTIYANLYRGAAFEIIEKRFSRIAMGSFKTCLEFVKDYEIANFQANQIEN